MKDNNRQKENVSEQIIQYVWQHKLYYPNGLTTTTGEQVIVENAGYPNSNAGPDYTEARISIGGIKMVGTVEIHRKASDWYRHSHHTDPAYSSVILHVVLESDEEVKTADGRVVPQLQITIPSSILDKINNSLNPPSPFDLPCQSVLPTIPKLTVHMWLTSIYVQRLQSQVEVINKRRTLCEMNWEKTLFITIARNFGFGVNGDVFEEFGNKVSWPAIGKHSDDLEMIEAMFFGVAGLLDDCMIPEFYRADAANDEYLARLRRNYNFMKNKFGLESVDPNRWKFLRMRPQNFPHIRIAQLAMLVYQGRLKFARMISAENVDELLELLTTKVSDYWKTHYTFSSTQSKPIDKCLSIDSRRLIVINSMVPMMFAYGKYKEDYSLMEKAVALVEQLPPEDNNIIRKWKNAGMMPESAMDSQALIEMMNKMCRCHDCLRCRFGLDFMKSDNQWLWKEDESQE